MNAHPCPLCGSPAQFEWIDRDNRKVYCCPVCTDFYISASAERRLASAPASWRENASRQARQGTEHRRLLITRCQPDPVETTAQAVLQWSWVPLHTLPR